MIEDHAAILSADICTLPIQCCWIMYLPENFQQFIKTDFCSVINYLNTFSMTGFACTDVLVTWICNMPACISGCHRNNTFELLKNCFGTPETPGAKGCGICFAW